VEMKPKRAVDENDYWVEVENHKLQKGSKPVKAKHSGNRNFSTNGIR